ncbi:hypothetical protein PUMCH_000846 [Australozyma saopauloensis]|uniref:Uncharacterized protein n=1 Tax=Australozyma saopauloensis TaxID=291208 RepID=A0AAX4H4V6_9ASCO|nr:hypothetical protein PUMCH_000846 [[Candida] saopauloensis]
MKPCGSLILSRYISTSHKYIYSAPFSRTIKHSLSAHMSQDQAVDKVNEAVALLAIEKKPKQRKAQTEEEFLAQKSQFEAAGPQINAQNWLFQDQILNNLDNSLKFDRVHMLHVCEKAYFERNYEQCLEYIKRAETLYGVDLDNASDNEDIKQSFSSAGRKTKKSSKVERHVVELLHIKEACLKRMQSS